MTSRALPHAQPPLFTGQPLPAFVQHHAFLGIDHPAAQFAYPALQSYGGDDVPGTQPPPPPLQPLPCTLQHHSFLPADHPSCQFAKPSAQL